MDVTLHERQHQIFSDDSRFKVVAAGRRFGKSFLAAVLLLVEASKTEKTRSDGVTVDLALEEVFYVGPTFDQSKKIIWPVLLELGKELIQSKQEMMGVLTLINGRRISIKGSDRPDNLRGTGLSFVVMDEYAFMREEVWELIIEPQLMRAEGGALFIGTPDGKNHFYELYQRGLPGAMNKNGVLWSTLGWKSWNFASTENPHLPKKELEEKISSMSKDRYEQEINANFEASGGHVLNPGDFVLVNAIPGPGDKYITIDLAGFTKAEQGKTLVQRDSHAIAVVHSHAGGWCVENIIHGQWDVRETALRIVKAFRDYRPVKIGIEKGIAKAAVMPYLEDEMTRLNTYFNVEDLTHGNQLKASRISWALQGRAEKGRIQLLRGKDETKWIPEFLQQCSDFPNQLAHDDLIDALAYIDQIADPYYDGPGMETYWEPYDEVSNY
jgi:phage terminase large subunit-like protein